jgi:hypothetical protein
MNKIDLAYTAGIVDGEGSIVLTRVRANTFVVMVIVSNTNIPLLEWLQQNFGGKVYQYESKSTSSWRLVSREEQDNFLALIEPYLRIKGPNVEIVKKYRELTGNKKPVTDEVALKRWELYQEMGNLNFNSGGKDERAAATTKRIDTLRKSVKR